MRRARGPFAKRRGPSSGFIGETGPSTTLDVERIGPISYRVWMPTLYEHTNARCFPMTFPPVRSSSPEILLGRRSISLQVSYYRVDINTALKHSFGRVSVIFHVPRIRVLNLTVRPFLDVSY